MSVRLEAPEEWRVREIAKELSLDEERHRRQTREIDAQREYLRHIYELRFPRKAIFHITYDRSSFTQEGSPGTSWR